MSLLEMGKEDEHMRLIDANALKKAMQGLLILQPPQRNTIFLTPDQFIDAVPTIDAIPVDWSQFGGSRKVISVLKNELSCVKKAELCDRQCAKCELVMEDDDIIAALECAIKAVELCAARMDAKEGKP